MEARVASCVGFALGTASGVAICLMAQFLCP